jgi:hypothetical protein
MSNFKFDQTKSKSPVNPSFDRTNKTPTKLTPPPKPAFREMDEPRNDPKATSLPPGLFGEVEQNLPAKEVPPVRPAEGRLEHKTPGQKNLSESHVAKYLTGSHGKGAGNWPKDPSHGLPWSDPRIGPHETGEKTPSPSTHQLETGSLGRGESRTPIGSRVPDSWGGDPSVGPYEKGEAGGTNLVSRPSHKD